MLANVVFVLSTALLASAGRSLSLKIFTPSPDISGIDDFRAVVIVSNTGSEALRLLRDPRSPLSTYPTEKFGIVNNNGLRAEFKGVRVRFDPVTVAKDRLPESFVELKAGESVTMEHDLSGIYNLTSTGIGTYTIEAANLFHIAEADGALTDIYADQAPAQVNIQGKLIALERAISVSAASRKGKRASYSGCSIEQQTQISSAIEVAKNYARDSHTHLTFNPSGSSRYRRWFGTFENSRYKAVLKSFSQLTKAPSEWTYDCSCQDPKIYAYVDLEKYGTAPATGAGSKADTIIHEGTHFNQILGTSDYAYSERECLNLAQSNATKAAYNADNHAFFSVNA